MTAIVSTPIVYERSSVSISVHDADYQVTFVRLTIFEQTSEHGGNLGVLHKGALASIPLFWIILEQSRTRSVGIVGRDGLTIERSRSQVLSGLSLGTARMLATWKVAFDRCGRLAHDGCLKRRSYAAT